MQWLLCGMRRGCKLADGLVMMAGRLNVVHTPCRSFSLRFGWVRYGRIGLFSN